MFPAKARNNVTMEFMLHEMHTLQLHCSLASQALLSFDVQKQHEHIDAVNHKCSTERHTSNIMYRSAQILSKGLFVFRQSPTVTTCQSGAHMNVAMRLNNDMSSTCM